MRPPHSFLPTPTPASWALTDDQRSLYAASQRFAREQLEPLLGRPPTVAAWQDIVKLAAALDLGAMILPDDQGGMAIDRHDLTLVIDALAAGPVERAAELTLSAPALMTLRAHHALGALSARPVQQYFDATTSIDLSIPSSDATMVWRLRPAADATGLTMLIDTSQRLILARRAYPPQSSRAARVATPGGLVLEKLDVNEALAGPPLRVIEQRDSGGIAPAQTWLTEAALYLSALLTGAMKHSVTFAFAYAGARQAFRKPLAAHQLVGTRLSEMLVAAHGSHLFLRSVSATPASESTSLIRQLIRHVAAESIDLSRELVQLCGGHGYVEGLPPAARFQSGHWFACLLMQIDATLDRFTKLPPERQPGISA